MERKRRALLAAALALTLGGAPACAGSPAISPAPRRLAGRILELHLGRGRLLLQGAGRRRTVLVSSETIVRRGGNTLTLDALRPGQRVVVALRPEAPHTARAIAVAGPAAAGRQARR